MTSYDKNTLQTLLNNPAYVDEAIVLLGANQTADELSSKDTKYHNDIGFSAAYARTGTRLYEFVTGIQTRTGQKKWQPKSLAHPTANRVFSRYINNHGLNDAVELGRKIALVHWRQLEALTTATVASLPTGGEPKPKKKAPAQVTLKGAEILRRSGKAVQVLWDSQKVWLPTSQIKWDSATKELTLPKWLAGKKGMNPRPYSTSTAVDDQGFNWATGEQVGGSCKGDGGNLSDEPRHFPMQDSGPQPGTWAYTARAMASMDDSGFDWDAWKDEMKERDL